MIGGGIASGKTSALLVSGAMQCSHPESRAIIFRKDFPSLRQIIASSYRLFTPMGATYNKSEHTWNFPGKRGGSGGTLEFSHLEDESTVYQKSGQDFSYLGFDEVCLLPADDVDAIGQPINSAFAFMQTRLRAPKDSGLRLECRCTGSPAGCGMNWVKNYFRIPDSGESCEFVDEVSGFRRAYFAANVKDNPAMDATEYARQLSGLSAARRKALLEGSWTAAEGQFFDTWSYAQHTCADFKIPSEFSMWRGGDDGYSEMNPAAVVWLAHDKIHNRIFVVRELYRSGMTPETMAHAVKQIDAEFGDDRDMDGCIDSSSFCDTGFSGGGRADVMNALGCGWSPSPKGAGSRASGWSAIRSRLEARRDGPPGLVVFRSCKNLIRTLPMLVYSTKRSDDIAENSEDHLADALRYGLTRKVIRCEMVRVRGL